MLLYDCKWKNKYDKDSLILQYIVYIDQFALQTCSIYTIYSTDPDLLIT